MIEGLKPYAEYKESGLPWLDTVPKHWDMAPNRALMRDQRHVVGARASDYTLLSLTLRGVIARDMVNPKGKFPAQFNTYKVVKPDDFVFCLFDIDETPRGVGLSPLKGMITGAYDIFSPTHRINPRFLYHYYLFVDEGKLMKPLYTGLRKTIQRGVFASLKAPLPPPDEQAAIVRFLDHANRKIDGFIRAKRKLIGLLNEQKQAIIHRAVTRGLHPDVPLKPSGIPWLGDIPKHWERTRLKFEASHIVDCLHATPTYLPDGIFPAIRTADIEPGKVRLEQARKISSKEFDKWTARLKPESGDILYSREGERFGIAANVPADTPLCISQRMMVFRIRKRQNSAYLMWQLNCQHVYLQASLYVIGSTAPHVNVDQIKNFQLALPPLDEQMAIVGHINAECSIINTAIARTEREIALMQEYRTRLTADLVTGKLDVRAVAAKLPEMEAEPAAEEALEESETEEAEA